MRQKLGAILLLGFFFLVSLATAVEARKVQVAVATFSQSVLPFVVAQEKGYYREEDLDVELILMTASVANMALLGGNVDFISSGSSAMGAIIRGAPLKFVFTCFNRPMHWLFSRPEIRDVKGLKGKKIGVSAIGGSAHFLVLEILKRYGLDVPREVTVFADARRLEQMLTNLVEPAGAIVIRESLLQSDPGLMEKFIRGTLKGLLHIRQNRSGTIPILARLMKIQEEVAGKIYDLVLPGLTADGAVNQELQKKVLEFVLKVQGIKELAATERVFDFAPVRRIRADLETKKWKPAP